MRFKDFVKRKHWYTKKHLCLVLDDADTKNPKIKDSVKKQIADQLKEFEFEYPILKTSLIGSILTKDIEMTQTLHQCFIWCPLTNKTKKRKIVQKYLSAKNPDNIQVN